MLIFKDIITLNSYIIIKVKLFQYLIFNRSFIIILRQKFTKYLVIIFSRNWKIKKIVLFLDCLDVWNTYTDNAGLDGVSMNKHLQESTLINLIKIAEKQGYCTKSRICLKLNLAKNPDIIHWAEYGYS